MAVAIARKAARRIFAKAGLGLPVDLEALAAWRGLTIELADGWHNSLCARLLTAERRIVVNADHILVRQRFSIAHELGHFVLGHDQVDVDHRVESIFGDEDESYQVTVDIEREANAFAAELLMPGAWVSSQAEALTKDQLMPAICRQCNVSQPAAWYRIMELKVGPFAPSPRRRR